VVLFLYVDWSIITIDHYSLSDMLRRQSLVIHSE